MKIRKRIFLQVLLFTTAISMSAQQNNEASVSRIHQQDSTIEFTIKTSGHLYWGANVYVLYIGDKIFSMSKQPKGGDGSSITFFIPIKDFRELENGTEASMTYGFKPAEDEKDRSSSARKEYVGRQWKLGKLNKQMLDK